MMTPEREFDFLDSIFFCGPREYLSLLELPAEEQGRLKRRYLEVAEQLGERWPEPANSRHYPDFKALITIPW